MSHAICHMFFVVSISTYVVYLNLYVTSNVFCHKYNMPYVECLMPYVMFYVVSISSYVVCLNLYVMSNVFFRKYNMPYVVGLMPYVTCFLS